MKWEKLHPCYVINQVCVIWSVISQQLCFGWCECMHLNVNLKSSESIQFYMATCINTRSAKEYVFKGGKQLIEARWEFESVMVHHHHFRSSQAEHSRLGCTMPAAIWLWMGLLRETQPGANLQITLPACLRMRMTCSSILWLCVTATTGFLQSCDTFTKTTCPTYVHSVSGLSSRAVQSWAI